VTVTVGAVVVSSSPQADTARAAASANAQAAGLTRVGIGAARSTGSR
jgi:hypothetical protein